MRGFQLAATRLALLRDRMERRADVGALDPADVVEERQFLELISAYRGGYVGRDPLAPAAHWDGVRYHVRFPDGVVRALDAPPQPVVPVPVPMPQMPPPPPGYPGLGGPGYGGPGYGGPPPGYPYR
jgi:hypothetical protein